MSFAVDVRGITKRFGTFTALDDVSLRVEPGTIHAIVGENGAGKTTLMRILYGALKPDSGELRLDDKIVNFQSSAEAIAEGIGMVSQHYAIIPELTTLQNLMLGAEGSMIPNRRDTKRRAEKLAAQMGFEFDWDRPAQQMSPAAAQKLEILKLLWRNSELMILDEPTAMLSPTDSDALFESLNGLVQKGKTILLVTHRLPEVLGHAEHVSVLRGGKLIHDGPVRETNASTLAQLIVGRAIEKSSSTTPATLGNVVLDLRSVEADRLDNVSLQLREGEVVGIAGVDGSGQRELFQAVAGIRPSRGDILVNGQPRLSTEEKLLAGLRIIPEDRHEEAIVSEWSLEHNSALGLQREPTLRKGARIAVGARQTWAEVIADRFGTKRASLSQPIQSLSGGNQQRFVAARALGMDPKVILAFQPVRGLDLGATAEVYQGIRKACAEGAAALIVSFELDELLEYCDRILVMHRGHLVESAKDRDQIGRLMVGA